MITHASRLPTCLSFSSTPVQQSDQAQPSKLPLVILGHGLFEDPCSRPSSRRRRVRPSIERSSTPLLQYLWLSRRRGLENNTIEAINGVIIHRDREGTSEREGCRSSRTAQRDTTDKPPSFKNTTISNEAWGWPLCLFYP